MKLPKDVDELFTLVTSATWSISLVIGAIISGFPLVAPLPCSLSRRGRCDSGQLPDETAGVFLVGVDTAIGMRIPPSMRCRAP